MWSFLDIWLPFLPHPKERVQNTEIFGQEILAESSRRRAGHQSHQPDRPDHLGPHFGLGAREGGELPL